MSDRYSDRHGSYYDEGPSRYDDQLERYSRASSSRYSSSGTTRASDGAGAYASNQRNARSAGQYRSEGAGQRAAQGSGATRQHQQGARREGANVFEGYYPDDAVGTYRRSAYGSGSSNSRSSYSRRSYEDRQPGFSAGQTVVPARRGQADGGSHGGSHAGASRSRNGDGDNGGYEPKRSNRKRNIIVAVVVVLAVVLVGAGAAWAYVSSISNNLHEGVTQEALDALEPAESVATETSLGDAPFYMLLMGVDLGEARRQEPNYAGDQWGRTDSMMLTRVDPVNKKVAIISVHRDTMVDLGEYGQQKINAAYEFYGPAGAIQAVSTMAGVPISHYATVDFDGFAAIVDALGGIEVDVPMEINDEVMPAHLDAGLQTLNGEQALILCRSRHSYDDVADDGDVMRAANQRMVISTIAKKILTSDIMTIANTVQTLSQYVTTDLELTDIIGLAQIFKDIDPAADIYTAMEPTTSAYIDETWYEYLDEEEWSQMIARMDQGLPPVNKTEIDERTGTILSTGGADAPVV